MSLAAGTRLGPYEVTAPLGAGGMGEVYRARDTRLGRDVAVKVLPTARSADAERLRRFEQEARAASVLNHPNILAVHDVGTHDGIPYVVTELLEGETLRGRLGPGIALPPRKAVDYAGQMARGLAAAHERGIVHRDLKPENLFMTRDGRVKILDFGLAKLTGIENMADSETPTAGEPARPGTAPGTLLGTVGYMSPEQVRAQPVDHRSDIFSFGAVFYEMLSGRRAFRGASAVETMNAILKEDPPDLSDTNRSLPPALERIVGHCLEKNPEERFQSARDIAFDLDALSGQTSQSVARPAPAARARWLKPVAAALAAALAVGAGFVAGRRRADAPIPEFKPLTFRRGIIDAGRFTADGHTIVYQARWEGQPPEIFSTQPGSPESRSLDLKDAVLGGVSSTGEIAIGLRRPGKPGRTLARVPLGGGAPRDVLENTGPTDWAPDGASFATVRRTGPRLRLEYPLGTTLYESSANMQNLRVSPTGDLVAFTQHPIVADARGRVVVVDKAGKAKTVSPDWEDLGGLAWTPDGREVWFTASNAGANRSLYAATLSGEVRLVSRVPGHMVLMDIDRDGRVLVSHGANHPVIMALVPGSTKERELTWLDYSVASGLSADGKTLLFSEQGFAGGAQYAVYLRGTDGNPAVRLGKGDAQALSPDGQWALAHDLAPPAQLVLYPTGAGEPHRLPRHNIAEYQAAWWMPDGKSIMLAGAEAGRGGRLYVQDVAGGPPRPVTPEGIFNLDDSLSPDGAYVAAGNETQGHIYPVAGGEPRPLPGFEPGDVPIRWSGDGRSLYVRKLSVVPVPVYRLDLATGQRTLWKELGPADLAGVRTITTVLLTPDARWYAYTYHSRLSNLYLVEGLK